MNSLAEELHGSLGGRHAGASGPDLIKMTLVAIATKAAVSWIQDAASTAELKNGAEPRPQTGHGSTMGLKRLRQKNQKLKPLTCNHYQEIIMSVNNDTNEGSEQHMAEDHGNGSDGVTAQCSVECGAEVFEHAEKAVSDAYDKTAQVVSETYEQAKKLQQQKSGQGNVYIIRDRRRGGISCRCQLSPLGDRPVCPTRGQRAVRYCFGVFPISPLS